MLSLLSGQSFKRVGDSAQRGPEWQGPCPVCGGNDRFHIWPEQGQGSFWCRACGKGGDLIEFYRWRDGLSYREACARAGVDPHRYSQRSVQASAVSKAKAAPPTFVPSAVAVNPVWAEHAAKFVEYCHGQLLASGSQLAWLAARGIDRGQIEKFVLGLNPRDTYRPRPAWDLPPLRKPDGSERKLWLPAGLVIPQVIDDQVARLRIRREDGAPKYYVVPGSGREPLVTNPAAIAHVIVESELDAILLDGLVADLPVGIVAMGNASAKPTTACHALFERAVHLAISLDSDKPRVNPATGKTESPGAQAALWWRQTYPQADRLPMVGGKDPGDAYKAGENLRAWLLVGLPPRFRLAAEDRSQTTEDGEKQDASHQDGAIIPSPVPCPLTSVYVTLTSGQEFYVTNDRATWGELVAGGNVVFSLNEVARLKEATAGAGEGSFNSSLAIISQIKSVFGHAYIRDGRSGRHRRACGMAMDYLLCPIGD